MIKAKSLIIETEGVPVLSELSFHITRGEKAVAIGQCGWGRSIFLRTLIGQHDSYQGRVHICGKLLTSTNMDSVRRRIGYISHLQDDSHSGTVEEFLYSPLESGQQHEPDKNEVEDLLERVNFESSDLKGKLTNCSYGKRQVLMIIRELLKKRDVLLLDQSDSVMDSETKNTVMDLLFERDDLTVLAVTNDADWAARSTQRIQLVDPFDSDWKRNHRTERSTKIEFR